MNPCIDSNPCSRTAECMALNHKAVCSCPTGMIGDPFINCYKEHDVSTPECVSDYECDVNKACVRQTCVNPCAESNPCSGNADCRVSYHRPLCYCPPGWGGDPKIQCYKRKFYIF